MAAVIICSICFEDYSSTDEIIVTCCGHIFHKHCLQDWNKQSSTCPQCRKFCHGGKQIFPQFAESGNKTQSEKHILKGELDKYKKSVKEIRENLIETEMLYAELMEKFQLLKMQHDELHEKNQNLLKNIECLKKQAIEEKNKFQGIQTALERTKSNEVNLRAGVKRLDNELNTLRTLLNINKRPCTKPNQTLCEQIGYLTETVQHLIDGYWSQKESNENFEQDYYDCQEPGFQNDPQLDQQYTPPRWGNERRAAQQFGNTPNQGRKRNNRRANRKREPMYDMITGEIIGYWK